MKTIHWLVLTIFIGLFACKDKTTVPISLSALTADFEIKKGDYGFILILNKSKNALLYTIDYGDGTVVSDSINRMNIFSPNSSHYYQENNEYTVVFTTFDALGNKASQLSKVVVSDLPLPVKADFSYEMLADGKVKFTNTSTNAHEQLYWQVSNYPYFYTNQQNPTYIFEKNGEYQISLVVSNKVPIHYQSKGSRDTKTIKLTITNASNYPHPSSFTGLFFGKNWDIISPNINTFYDTWGLVALSGISCNSFGVTDFGHIFIMNGDTRKLSTQEKYEKFKSQFKKGQLSLKEWDVRLSKNTSVWATLKETFSLANDPKAYLEIIEVQEIDQPKLLPEMYDKAFWITFKIKADFGDNNKVDGVLKVRYLIY